MAAVDYAVITPNTAPLWQKGGSRAEAAAAALKTYLANVLDRPSQLRYRRIRVSSDGFSRLVAACPGALEVLQHCGFTRSQLPDGEYWIMHKVDERLLRDTLGELSCALRTASVLREARSRSAASDSGAPASDSGARASTVDGAPTSAAVPVPVSGELNHTELPAHPTGVSGEHFAATAALTKPTREDAAYEMRRQLRARAAVHHAMSTSTGSRTSCVAIALCWCAVLCVVITSTVGVWRLRRSAWAGLLQLGGLPPPPLCGGYNSPHGAVTACLGLLALWGIEALSRPMRFRPLDGSDEAAQPQAEPTRAAALGQHARSFLAFGRRILSGEAATAARASPRAALARGLRTCCGVAMLVLACTALEEELCLGAVPDASTN